MRKNSSLVSPPLSNRVSVPQMNSGCVGRCSGSAPSPGQFAPQSVDRVSVPQMNSGCVGRCSGSAPSPGQFTWN